MGVGRVCRGGMHRCRGRGGGVGIDQALRRGEGCAGGDGYHPRCRRRGGGVGIGGAMPHTPHRSGAAPPIPPKYEVLFISTGVLMRDIFACKKPALIGRLSTPPPRLGYVADFTHE